MTKIADFDFAVQKYNRKKKRLEDVTEEELDKMLDGFINVVESLNLSMGGGGRLVNDESNKELKRKKQK